MSTGSLYNTRNANARRYFSTILPIPIQLPKYNLFSSSLTLFSIEGLFFPHFIVTTIQQRLLTRFATEFFRSFPNIGCAYCGILILPRSVKWQTYDPDAARQYQLLSVLNCPLTFNLTSDHVAICAACSRRPRSAPDVGPWSDIIFEVPQQWRRLLSPIQLHCNLGRTQSQSATGFHNPYSTYRTLKGIFFCPASHQALCT